MGVLTLRVPYSTSGVLSCMLGFYPVSIVMLKETLWKINGEASKSLGTITPYRHNHTQALIILSIVSKPEKREKTDAGSELHEIFHTELRTESNSPPVIISSLFIMVRESDLERDVCPLQCKHMHTYGQCVSANSLTKVEEVTRKQTKKTHTDMEEHANLCEVAPLLCHQKCEHSL